MDPTYVIALEIGSSKIRGAAGTVDASGTLTVVAVEEERLVDGVRHGWIRNVEEVSSRIGRIVKKLENRLKPRIVRKVYVALGGLTFGTTRHEISRRLPEEGEFTDNMRDEFRREALGTMIPERDIIDVTERRILIDRTHVAQPVGAYGQDIKYECNLITARTRARQMFKRVLEEKLHIDIAGFVVRPIAEANLVLTPDEKKLGVVLVDFGAETTTVSVYKQGYLHYLGTLPLGSRNITIDIMALNYLEEKAEELKKIGGSAYADRLGQRFSSDGVSFDEINNYVAARSGEIIANINAQIQYSELSPTQLPGGIVIIGSGAKLSGFNERLEQETKLPVRIGIPSAYVRIMDGRTQGADAVDVISVLYDAARRGPQECTESPKSGATDTGTEDYGNEFTQPEPKPQPKQEPKQKKPKGFLNTISKAINTFMNDDTDDEFDS